MEKRYQIFISSTFADLVEERQEVMEAIININCFPAGMEMFPAADMEQFEYIKTIIDKSDYYVLVIAGRYGSVDYDGISYTEKEFNYAKEKGIPVLVFVKEDIENIDVSKTDRNPELKKKLDEFRNKVMTNRLAKFWSNGQDLKYKVHDSLTRAFAITPRTGWVKGNEVAEVEVLKNSENLRVRNAKLEAELTIWKNQVKEMEKEKIKNIAQGDEKVTIKYKFKNSNLKNDSYKDGEQDISWNDLFALAGPYFISPQNISNSQSIIESSLLRYMDRTFISFYINPDDFNTIKLQFDALNLIRCYVGNLVNGGTSEVMQLTQNGKEKLNFLKLKINNDK